MEKISLKYERNVTMKDMKQSRRARRSKRSPWWAIIVALLVLGAVAWTLFSWQPWQLGKVAIDKEVSEETATESVHLEDEEAENEVTIEPYTIRLSFVGDLLMHIGLNDTAYNPEEGTYDYSPMLEYVAPHIKPSDVAFANLETTFSGEERGYGGYPLFNTPDAFLDAIVETGFDLLNTTNNHSFDGQVEGLIRTTELVASTDGIDPIGTYADTPESRVHYREVEDITIAFLTYAEMFNGMVDPVEDRELLLQHANFIDEELILEDIEEAKKQGVDFIVANMHWGTEYQTEPNDFQRQYTELLVENGVDLVIGGHPHVIQPAEVVEHGGNKAFVIYSLGNFLSNQRIETLGAEMVSTEDGVILHLDIEVNEDKMTLSNVEFEPTWVYREGGPIYDYHVLPIEDFLENPRFAEHYLDRLEASKARTEEVLGMYGIFEETFNFELGIN